MKARKCFFIYAFKYIWLLAGPDQPDYANKPYSIFLCVTVSVNIFFFFYTFKWIHTIHTIHVTGHNCTKVYITISIARFERTPTVRSPKRRDQRVHVEF